MLSKTQDIIWKYLLKPEGFLKNLSMFTKSFISGTNRKPWELKTLAFISNFCLCVFINESQFISSVTCLKSDNINQNTLCKKRSRLNLMYATASPRGVCSWNTIFCKVYAHLHFYICVLLRLWLCFIHKMSAKSKKKKKSFTSPSFKQCFCKLADENVTDVAVSAVYWGNRNKIKIWIQKLTTCQSEKSERKEWFNIKLDAMKCFSKEKGVPDLYGRQLVEWHRKENRPYARWRYSRCSFWQQNDTDVVKEFS